MNTGDRIRIIDFVGVWDENLEHTGITKTMIQHCGKCGQIVEKINVSGAITEDSSEGAPIFVYVLDVDSGKNFWLEDWLEVI